jgi:hypothetical protein
VTLDDRYANKFAPLDCTTIYPKPGHQLIYTPLTGEIKCPRLYLCLVHSIPSPPILMHMHQPITNDMIHFISSCDRIGSLILTSLALYRCFGPSVPSHRSTCPSHLQPVCWAKSCLDLIHLDHMTQCHVSCVMSSFITCVSLTTSSIHLHRHGIYCSHTCTCGLITYVSHINTISHLGCHLITKIKQGPSTTSAYVTTIGRTTVASDQLLAPASV